MYSDDDDDDDERNSTINFGGKGFCSFGEVKPPKTKFQI